MEVFFAQLVISLILSVLFAPDIEPPEAATLEDFDAPKVNPGSNYPVIFGTYLLKSANILWYGDLATTEVVTDAGK